MIYCSHNGIYISAKNEDKHRFRIHTICLLRSGVDFVHLMFEAIFKKKNLISLGRFKGRSKTGIPINTKLLSIQNFPLVTNRNIMLSSLSQKFVNHFFVTVLVNEVDHRTETSVTVKG